MNEFKIGLLPKWVLTSPHPGFYDSESMSAIQMVAKVYAKMNELVEAYNQYVDRVNTRVEEFITSQEKDFELFRVELRQEFQDFIDVVELKIGKQDQIINDFVTNMTNAFNEFESSLNGKFLQLATQQRQKLQELEEEVDQVLEDFKEDSDKALSDLDTEFDQKIEDYNAQVGQAIAGYDQQIQNAITGYNSSFNQKITEFTNLFNQELENYQAQVNTAISDMQGSIDTYISENISQYLVNADWDEQDETSKAFILHKPFYKLHSEFVTLFGLSLPAGNLVEYPANENGNADFDNRTTIRCVIKDSDDNILHDFGFIEFEIPTSWSTQTEIFRSTWDNVEYSVYLVKGSFGKRYGYTANGTPSKAYQFVCGSYITNCKYLDPIYLAPVNSVGSHLETTNDGKMQWSNDYLIYSNNGVKFKITVSDDGTLSTEAVTETTETTE